MFRRIMARIGYVPAAEANQALREASRERARARAADARYDDTTTARARELAAVTARIPVIHG